MITPKCPVKNCNSTGFQIVQSKGINLLVCDSGHVISRDYSNELANLANEISSAAIGVNKTVTTHAQAIVKILKEINEATGAPSKKG